MPNYLILRTASYRIDDIYQYTRESWGENQAQKYVHGLFACFEDIAAGRVNARPISSAYEVVGYFVQYEKHFVYWKTLDDGTIGIATILHERMNLGDRLIEDLEL